MEFIASLNVFAKSRDIAKALRIQKCVNDEGLASKLSRKTIARVNKFNQLFNNVTLSETHHNECRFANVTSTGATATITKC